MSSSAQAKRIFDIGVAVAALFAVWPLMLLIALLVRLRLGSPVLFRQNRPGLHGRVFSIYKFRTMRDLVDADGQSLADADRLTPLGRFLRSTSIDELPEIFNVIRGEMSIVGPRPLLVEYLDRYTPTQMRRHEVRPGITGWAQVNGRNAISWDEKFRLDVSYVDHRSLAFDMKIIFMTVWTTLKRRNISQAGHATAEVFQGTSESQPGPRVDPTNDCRGGDWVGSHESFGTGLE